MSKFIFILALITVGYLIYQLYLKQMKKPNRQDMIKYALVAGGIFFIIMAVTGRASAIFAAIGAVMTAALRYYPLLLRHLPELRRAYRKFIGGAAGAATTSRVTTAVFVMTLDHASGHMDGEVTEGPFTGRHLSELSIEELQSLLRYCQSRDSQSVQVLRAYLQREREQNQDYASGDSAYVEAGNAKTTEEEAWEILGLEPGADKKAIIDAHRRLMSRLHPDKGGTNYLASKINQAKDILLKTV